MTKTKRQAGSESQLCTGKLAQLEMELAALLQDISKRGYYGTAGVMLSVQDGHIQNIRVSTERLIK